MSVYLQVPAEDDAFQPSGWSQHAEFSLTLVSQTNEKCNVKQPEREGPTTSHTFKAGEMDWGFTQFLALAALNDTTIGYIANDNLIIKCDMTNISSDVSAAAAAAAAATAAAATPTDRVAVPPGLYPTGAGGLLYIPAGALASNKEPVDATQ